MRIPAQTNPQHVRPGFRYVADMLYSVSEGTVERVTPTTAPAQDLYERDLEDWIETEPSILGEDLLMIGRQVGIDDGKDRIDLLAVDKQGSLAILELKRDLIGGDADLQGLRYAAAVSRWTFDQTKTQAEGYWKTMFRDRGTLGQELETFCDDGYEVNGIQRIILVGREIKPRLGSMALWLRQQGIDIRVVSIQLFEDGGRMYLQPQVVIPPPSEEAFTAVGKVASSDRPWLRDGERWHLEERMSGRNRQIIEGLVDIVNTAVPEADGPNWNQKAYISWRKDNRIWANVDTGSPNVAYIHVKGVSMDHTEAAELLGWEVFDGDADLSDKFGLGSNVGHRAKYGDTRFTVKSADDLTELARGGLASILRDAWEEFSG